MRSVSSVTFNPDGSCLLEFNILPDDVRENGMMQSHALLLAPSEDTIDAVEALQDQAGELLDQGIDIFESTPVAEDMMVLEDEEDVSPYDNPNERDLGEARG